MTLQASNHLPIQFKPIFKDKIWGGRNLYRVLAKDLPPDLPVGESWEISGYETDISVATNSGYCGKTLQEIITHAPQDILGIGAESIPFPLLYKFIDANDKLSVQVHPNDQQVAEHDWGINGKTECWYIVDAKPQAEIIVGFNEGVTKSMVKEGIKENTLGELLNKISIQKGDMLFIPSQTVHAILDGTLLYEVQQSSDITFRLYDWGRVDKLGSPRDLHITESLQCINTTYHDEHKISPLVLEDHQGVLHTIRVACRHFMLEEYDFAQEAAVQLQEKKSFSVISVLNGPISIISNQSEELQLSTGQTVLIPAALNSTSITITGEAHSTCILSCVPDLKKDVLDPLQKTGHSAESIAKLGGHKQGNDLLDYL